MWLRLRPPLPAVRRLIRSSPRRRWLWRLRRARQEPWRPPQLLSSSSRPSLLWSARLFRPPLRSQRSPQSSRLPLLSARQHRFRPQPPLPSLSPPSRRLSTCPPFLLRPLKSSSRWRLQLLRWWKPLPSRTKRSPRPPPTLPSPKRPSRKRLSPSTAPRDTPILHHRPRRCPRGGWSCPTPVPGQSIRRLLLSMHPQRRARVLPPASFSAASPSSTASPLEQPARAATPSAPHSARPEHLVSSPADRDPSTPHAPPRAAMPVPAVQALPEHVPALALVPALPADHHVPASAAHAPGLADPRQPARLRARSAHPPEAAADARSTPRPKKAP